MAVPAIALYSSPPSSMYDFDSLGSRSIPSASTSTSTSQRPFVGGLSSLFSSSSVKHSSSSSYACGAEELSPLRAEELSGSFTHSFASYMKRDNSPVSVFQGPVSCSTSGAGSSRSPPMRLGRDCSVRAGNDRLFSGHALASFVDYDSLSFQTRRDPLELEELTFNMDDQFKESSYESFPYAKDLLLAAQTRHKIFFDQVVVKAFCEAEKAHSGQVRASGDPYLQHCVETAVLLAMVGANSTVVAAGLLHDTLDDSFMSYDYILQTFGADVADLVEGVSKLSQLSKLARESNTANRTVEADRLHTMFLAMADVRVVLIKLADRLHNMMTLEALPIDKQRRFAKETSEIFVPLVNRLGIASWKEQLENLCFKHINPELHKGLSSQLVKSFDEAVVTSAAGKLERALKDNNIYHVLSGRHKSLYSIHCKMLKKKLTMDEIHDIHGVRLIVDNEEDCYKALEIVHQLWSEVPGKFKDYIHHPKDNGYQSLHTVVVGEGSVPLEVQIRTKEMHSQAEFGFAAHWRYKEGDCKHSSFVVQRVEWARWVLTWQSETMIKEKSPTDCSYSIKPRCSFPFHSEDCPYVYKPYGSSTEPVFVVTIENNKMSVQEFPANSTIMDLLERAGRGSSGWTPDGFPKKEELMPRVNNVPVSDPTCKLKMGDKVELSPTIPDRALTDYREEIQRMYDRDLSVSSTSMRPAASTIGWKR